MIPCQWEAMVIVYFKINKCKYISHTAQYQAQGAVFVASPIAETPYCTVGLLLGTEASASMPNGTDFSLPSFATVGMHVQP